MFQYCGEMSDAVDLNTSAVVYLTDGKNIKLMTKISVRSFIFEGDLSVNVLVLMISLGAYLRRKELHLQLDSQTS